MAATNELSIGQSADLVYGYLRVRLVADTAGLRLNCTNAGGADLAEVRDSDVAVVARPVPDQEFRFVVESATGGPVPDGTRVGLEVTVDGAPKESSRAVQVIRTDVGGFLQHELARAEVAGEKWRVSVGSSASDPFAHVFAGAAVGARLDERNHPWVVAGRRELRRARGGVDVPATGDAWGVVVDGSASFLAAAEDDEIATLATVVAGILAEWSGTGPCWVGSTGLLSPVAASGGVPADVVKVLDRVRQPSWTLVAPAVEQAVSAGAHRVAVLLDGPPSDLSALRGLLHSVRGVDVVLVVLGGDSSWLDFLTPQEGGGRAPLRAAAVTRAANGELNWTDVAECLSEEIR